MDDRELEAEIRRLAEQGGHEPMFSGPAPDEAIETAERELSVRFPRSYRAFLRRLGAALMMSQDFAGLPVPPPPDQEDFSSCFDNVVASTRQCWKGATRTSSGVPRHLIYVSSDGGDYYYYIDASQRDERDESPIVVMGPGAVGVVVADDFLDFVRKLARNDRLF